MFRLILGSALLSCVLVLSGCGGGGYSTSGNGLNIFITDAPIDDAVSVKIGISGIKVIGSGGVYNLPIASAVVPDFYQYQGGAEGVLIPGANLPGGNYQAIVLDLNAAPGNTVSSLTLNDGTVHTIYIPAGEPTSIQIPVNFTVPVGSTVNITLDFDLRKSLIQDPNDSTQYILMPAIRAINNDDQGAINGFVNPDLIPDNCSSSVYAYTGDVTPTDVDITAPAGSVQPITSSLVSLNTTTGKYNFSLAFLPPGQYTLAFTCQAGLDQPDKADAIQFTSIAHASVSIHSNAIVTLN